ncbi:hypothetical protein T484DRAFT_1758116 [Baffinella frigidus]|nr:hypothetical protein T484DRAFT_1758116 [Cryptophyta sp. CCMP2293]
MPVQGHGHSVANGNDRDSILKAIQTVEDDIAIFDQEDQGHTIQKIHEEQQWDDEQWEKKMEKQAVIDIKDFEIHVKIQRLHRKLEDVKEKLRGSHLIETNQYSEIEELKLKIEAMQKRFDLVQDHLYTEKEETKHLRGVLFTKEQVNSDLSEKVASASKEAKMALELSCELQSTTHATEDVLIQLLQMQRKKEIQNKAWWEIRCSQLQR